MHTSMDICRLIRIYHNYTSQLINWVSTVHTFLSPSALKEWNLSSSSINTWEIYKKEFTVAIGYNGIGLFTHPWDTCVSFSIVSRVGFFFWIDFNFCWLLSTVCWDVMQCTASMYSHEFWWHTSCLFLHSCLKDLRSCCNMFHTKMW